MSQKKRVGRPKVTDKPDIVSLLVTAFHNGMNVREACWQSGISHEAYYGRIRSDEQFADTMAKAQTYATVSAKMAVISAIEKGDVAVAKWWLERRARNEFGRDIIEPEPEKLPPTIEQALEVYENREKIDAWKARMKAYAEQQRPMARELSLQYKLPPRKKKPV